MIHEITNTRYGIDIGTDEVSITYRCRFDLDDAGIVTEIATVVLHAEWHQSRAVWEIGDEGQDEWLELLGSGDYDYVAKAAERLVTG